jgi:hypothetical protein
VRQNVDITLSGAKEPLATINAEDGSVTTDPITGKTTVAQQNGNKADITVTRTVVCADDQITPTSVTLTLNGVEYSMTATENSNEYSAIIPADKLEAGELAVVAECSGSDESTSIGTVTLYDPSGFVTDSQTKKPVQGATVTLYKVPGWEARKSSADNEKADSCESNESKEAGAAWSQVTPANLGVLVNTDIIVVNPRINHMQTDSVGHYGWDVPTGCWYVVVEAEGYHTLTSPVVGVPSEVTDLDLELVSTKMFVYLPVIVR